MATTNTDNSPRIEVLVHRNGTGVDIEKTVEEARKVATAYANDDKEATAAIVAVTNKIVANEKYKDMSSVTAGVLAKMALAMMGEIPTDKLCAEAEVRVKSYLAAQPEKYVFIERGRNAGFHIIDRLNKTPGGKETLAKLLKEKATSDAKRSAEAAAEAAVAKEGEQANAAE
jgi:ribosomal protein RSM22 (predicted rRNA methylase)